MNDDLYIKIDKLYNQKNIPNIIFHGNYLTGKKTLLEYLLKKIYKTNENIENYVLTINCSQGKGNIKFMRENLIHFANMIINRKNGLFKSIILLNADKLTIDAQSALRRIIEIYNHSTRFFIIVDNKYKLLKPILSRFSEIYCDAKNCDKKIIDPNISILDNSIKYDYTKKKNTSLNKYLINQDTSVDFNFLIDLSHKLYNNGYSSDILINYIDTKLPNGLDKYNFLFLLDIYKKEIRNEIILIMFTLNYIYFRNNIDLENIRFI